MSVASDDTTSVDVDDLPLPVVLVGANGVIGAANERATELLSLTTATGVALADVLHGLDRFSERRQRCRVIGTSRELNCWVAHRHDGDAVIVMVESTPDPTASETIAVVSHELRSPLTSLSGFVGLLRSRWDRLDDAARLDLLGQVEFDATRVTRLVHELLDISRLDAGRLQVRIERFDLGAVVRGVVDHLALIHPGLRCTVEIADEAAEIVADPGKVEQILVNLIENAAKYGDAGDVSVSASVEPGGDGSPESVRILVTDGGDGVPEHDRVRIFDRFHGKTDGRPDGLGLGLFISRGLAEAHGGTLELLRNAPPGATFCLTLPRVPPLGPLS